MLDDTCSCKYKFERKTCLGFLNLHVTTAAVQNSTRSQISFKACLENNLATKYHMEVSLQLHPDNVNILNGV